VKSLQPWRDSLEDHNKLEDIDKDFTKEYVDKLVDEIFAEIGKTNNDVSEECLSKLVVSFQNHINKATMIVHLLPDGTAKQSIKATLRKFFEQEEKVGFMPLLRVGIKK
jgi:hypothetical protein